MDLPSTTDRVNRHTVDHVNRRIQQRTEDSIAYYRAHPGEIGQRLEELDQEWDIERSLEANAASLMLIGSALALTVSRKFFALPVLVSGFLLQHALQGWCPPLPILRRMGFRTAAEINREREALLAVRPTSH